MPAIQGLSKAAANYRRTDNPKFSCHECKFMYTGVLAAADVFTQSTTFWVMESIRLDLGYPSYVHP